MRWWTWRWWRRHPTVDGRVVRWALTSRRHCCRCREPGPVGVVEGHGDVEVVTAYVWLLSVVAYIPIEVAVSVVHVHVPARGTAIAGVGGDYCWCATPLMVRRARHLRTAPCIPATPPSYRNVLGRGYMVVVVDAADRDPKGQRRPAGRCRRRPRTRTTTPNRNPAPLDVHGSVPVDDICRWRMQHAGARTDASAVGMQPGAAHGPGPAAVAVLPIASRHYVLPFYERLPPTLGTHRHLHATMIQMSPVIGRLRVFSPATVRSRTSPPSRLPRYCDDRSGAREQQRPPVRWHPIPRSCTRLWSCV